MEKVYRGYKKVVEGFCLFLFLLATSCAIENDIPYPVVNGGITDIRVSRCCNLCIVFLCIEII